jgi:phosphoribosyl-ATP pyrophosphohydrolase
MLSDVEMAPGTMAPKALTRFLHANRYPLRLKTLWYLSWAMSRFTVHDLAATIDARAASGGEASYTRKLLDKGAEHCAKKLGEEAVETVIAAIENDRDHLIAESADLLFHLLVLLKARGVKLEDVEAALAERTGMSGLEEKASRKREG